MAEKNVLPNMLHMLTMLCLAGHSTHAILPRDLSGLASATSMRNDLPRTDCKTAGETLQKTGILHTLRGLHAFSKHTQFERRTHMDILVQFYSTKQI